MTDVQLVGPAGVKFVVSGLLARELSSSTIASSLRVPAGEPVSAHTYTLIIP